MDPHFLNGSQDGSVRGRGGLMGRGRGGPPGLRWAQHLAWTLCSTWQMLQNQLELNVTGDFSDPFHNPTHLRRGRGMPRGGPRGAMRGGAPRGGLGRGSAPRGAPSGRGGPASATSRGGAAPRSRPPTAGAPRMLPTPSMSHQQGPAASQPKVEGYEDYVSSPAPSLVWDVLCFRGCGVVFCVPTAAVSVDRMHFLSVLWRVLSRDWLRGLWELLHPAASSRVSFCVFQLLCSSQHGSEGYIFTRRDTEYYDYGHGEAQETTYESYSESFFSAFPLLRLQAADGAARVSLPRLRSSRRVGQLVVQRRGRRQSRACQADKGGLQRPSIRKILIVCW